MKNSQFNSVVKYKTKYILYNSLYNKLLILNDSSEDVVNCIKGNNIEPINSLNSSLYSKLVKDQFFVDANTDELSIFKSKYKEVSNDTTWYKLTINPTMGCTFKCWYCYEEHLAKSKLSENTLARTKLLMKNIIKENPKLEEFHLSFFGGEPLMYFNQVCMPLIDEWKKLISEHKIEYPILSFTTNGYLIKESIIDSLREHANYTSLQITLDGYKDDHDKVRYISAQKGSYNTIVTNIKKLAEANFFITMRINYTPDNLESCVKIIQDFEDLDPLNKRYINVSFNCVWQEAYKMKNRYADLIKVKQHFMDAGFSTDSNVALNPLTNMCYADKTNSSVINYNGDVFKCTARPFDTPKREGFLDENGSIIWDNEKRNHRVSSQLKNKPCQTCRILPRCFGGCSQNQIEATQDYCVHGFDQQKIDNLIIDHIKQFVDLDK